MAKAKTARAAKTKTKAKSKTKAKAGAGAKPKAKRQTRSSTARPSREELRAMAARRRRNTNLMLIGGATAIVLLVGWLIFLNIRSQQPVGSEQRVATQGNAHIASGNPSPIQYNTTPPTSGPHYGGIVNWGVYRAPQRYEQVLHNLEDGGVAVYYQCDDGCPELFAQLEEVVQPYVDDGQHVLLLQNDPTWTINGSQPLHQDMGARIALTAWQRIDKFDEFDADRIRAFIERYEGIDHHQ